MEHTAAYRDATLARSLIQQIKNAGRRPARLMEVCGTHTVSIFRSGIRSVMPETISLLSGPGCPVCVTDQSDIDAFIALSDIKDVIVTTFGDLMRVPGSGTSLQQQKGEGRDIRVVYSTMDAMALAQKNSRKQVVFLGVGFETTAPTIAAAIKTAEEMGLSNFSVFAAHKRVPPALNALMQADAVKIDGFILPGHVSVVIGLQAYRPFFERYRVPCVVAGFEPVDILYAVQQLVDQIENNTPQLANAYGRAVAENGNPSARRLMAEIFDIGDAVWRGIGRIPRSGLYISAAYAAFDARRRFSLSVPASREPEGCACGEILTGAKTPPMCPLFRSRCTPSNPVGPCMVSTEGTCAAYFRYGGH